MDDYISREAVIDSLQDWKGNCMTDAEEWHIRQVIGDVKSLPAAEVKPVRWIPVEERLPEAGGTYLCVWQGKTVNTGFFCNGHFRLYGEIKDHLITHWMPLPELPSVNGKETEHDPEREG